MDKTIKTKQNKTSKTKQTKRNKQNKMYKATCWCCSAPQKNSSCKYKKSCKAFSGVRLKSRNLQNISFNLIAICLHAKNQLLLVFSIFCERTFLLPIMYYLGEIHFPSQEDYFQVYMVKCIFCQGKPQLNST